MQTIRITPRICRAACAPPTLTKFTTRFPSSEILPLFRLLDSSATPTHHHKPNFSPRFDVRETSSAYELQGELPGIKQEDVSIEFVDGSTLVVKGQAAERETFIAAANGEQEEEKSSGNESPATVVEGLEEKSANHQATVEDEYIDAGVESQSEGEGDAATPAATTTTDADAGTKKVVEAGETIQHKYWISERRTGQFERRFRFAGQLDRDAVKASLKNGVLNIVVPKEERKERRILVE